MELVARAAEPRPESKGEIHRCCASQPGWSAPSVKSSRLSACCGVFHTRALDLLRTLLSPVSTAQFARRCWIAAGLLIVAIVPIGYFAGTFAAMLRQWAFCFALGAAAVAAVGRPGWIPATQLGLVPSRFDVRGQLVASSACLALILALAAVFPGEPSSLPVTSLEPVWLRQVLFFLTLVALPAFFEELFFRGALQRLLTLRWGPHRAIVLASLAFALFHLYAGPQGMVFALLMGLCLGYVAYRAGSLQEVMLVHAINNSLVFAWQAS